MSVGRQELLNLYVGGRASFGLFREGEFVNFSGYSGQVRVLDDDPFVFLETGIRAVGAVGAVSFDDSVPLRQMSQSSLSVLFDNATITFGTLADSLGARVEVLRFVTDSLTHLGREVHAFVYRYGERLSGATDWNSFEAEVPPQQLRWSDFLVAPVVGTAGPDRLAGDAAPNRLLGLGGNDVLEPGAGTTFVDGGPGIDTLRFGGAWMDVSVSFGRARVGDMLELQFTGIERIVGSPGDDVLMAIGSGATTLVGRGGDDRLFGSATDDVLQGGGGADLLYGGGGDDRLFGGAGRDQLFGGAGDDTLNGGAGADTLQGGSGQNRLFGGAGQDLLIITSAGDVATGGAGADTFRFAPGFGDATIRDFGNGRDVISLVWYDGIGFEDVGLSARPRGTRVDVGGDSILLLGVRPGAIGADDFLF